MTQIITPLTIIESPFSGDTFRNVLYAQAAVRDSIARGETPFASHLFFTQVLQDELLDEREQGFRLASRFYGFAKQVVLYTDLGISKGMIWGMERARDHGIPVVQRQMFPEGPLNVIPDNDHETADTKIVHQ